PTLPVDSGFADPVLARLFALPSRISAEQWKGLATQIGSNAAPPNAGESSASNSASEAAKPEAASGASLGDLLASLSSLKGKMEEIEKESRKTAASAEPVYCPAYDWEKAFALVQEMDNGGPGAHRRKLTVSFAPEHPHANIEYARVTPQAIDADHASLDN